MNSPSKLSTITIKMKVTEVSKGIHQQTESVEVRVFVVKSLTISHFHLVFVQDSGYLAY